MRFFGRFGFFLAFLFGQESAALRSVAVRAFKVVSGETNLKSDGIMALSINFTRALQWLYISNLLEL